MAKEVISERECPWSLTHRPHSRSRAHSKSCRCCAGEVSLQTLVPGFRTPLNTMSIFDRKSLRLSDPYLFSHGTGYNSHMAPRGRTSRINYQMVLMNTPRWDEAGVSGGLLSKGTATFAQKAPLGSKESCALAGYF